MRNSTTNVFLLILILGVVHPGVGLAETSDRLDRSQYALHRSELIRDFALTGTLGLTQLLIPLNRKSQRLFPDDVNDLDQSIRNAWHTKSDNFLDGNIGSLWTPFAAAAIITGLNWREERPWGQTEAELLIFANGAVASGLLTQSFKQGFSRRRPLLEFASPTERAELDAKATNHQSFYSGHASTAFYSASFLRRRISQSLTRHGHTGIKSGYQWLTDITLYGWASYVAYSRIQIDKHYFTDVAMGALMGMLFEEVYYRFNLKHWNAEVTPDEIPRSGASWTLMPQVTPASVDEIPRSGASWTLMPQVTPASVEVYLTQRF